MRRNARPRNVLELIRRETPETTIDTPRATHKAGPGLSGYRGGCRCPGCSQAKRESARAYYLTHPDVWKRLNEKRRAARLERALASFVDG